MRKLIMKMSVTVDGFVSGLQGENDWVFKTGDEESKAWSAALYREPGLLIMGRISFESMMTYWPAATGPFAVSMNEIPKALFTKKGFKGSDPGQATTAVGHAQSYNEARGILHKGKASAAEISWGDARVFDGDLAGEISELKAKPGTPIMAVGGAGFMRSLIEAGLIDEFHLAIHPVALGAGLPIFNGLSKPFYLKLADVRTFPGGVVVHSYHI